MSDYINEPTLKQLIDANAIRSVVLVADADTDGFAVVLRIGMKEKRLASHRRQTRVFKKIDTAARFLRGVGLPEFEVDTRQWNRVA
ncbi:MAG: hypothetical protein AB2660_18895 [Candidatus Thiodiazotropha sp.]